jgi:hemolysin III
MADISGRITRKSLKAKRKAAIKAVKIQAKEKIKEIKITYDTNPAVKQAKLLEKEQKKQERIDRRLARIASSNRQVKQYSLGESILNSIIQGIAAGLSVAALVLLVLRALSCTPQGESKALYVTSFAIFGSFLILLYLMTCLYYALRPYGAKKVFSIFNHTSIYLLIAATYTPFALTMIKGSAGWAVFGIIWACAVLGIVLYSVFGSRLRNISALTYIIMGWLIVFAFNPLSASLPKISFAMLIAGGAAYTVSCLFYFMDSRKWSRSIFHLFVIAGSVLHFFSVYFSIGLTA